VGIFGGGLGSVAGGIAMGPVGLVAGAGLGSSVEDEGLGTIPIVGGLLGGSSSPSSAVSAGTPVQYQGTGYDYGTGMSDADARRAYTANYGVANQDRAQGQQSRNDQLQELERLRATARGEGPSAAALQMEQAQEIAAANAANIAASARGTGAQAQASHDAIRAQMAGAQTSARDTAIIRAQEALQAQQAATGLVSGMRTQSAQDRATSGQQAQFQAGQQQANRGQNDARSMGLLQAQIDEAKARAATASGQAGREQQASAQTTGNEISQYQANKDRQNKINAALISAGATAGSTALKG
jgi:hypothetical protein